MCNLRLSCLRSRTEAKRPKRKNGKNARFAKVWRKEERTYEEHVSGLSPVHARPLDLSDLRYEPVKTVADLLH